MWFRQLSMISIVIRFPGIQGPQGMKGDKGLTGSKGEEGKLGKTGPQGERGPQVKTNISNQHYFG